MKRPVDVRYRGPRPVGRRALNDPDIGRGNLIDRILRRLRIPQPSGEVPRTKARESSARILIRAVRVSDVDGYEVGQLRPNRNRDPKGVVEIHGCARLDVIGRPSWIIAGSLWHNAK
jgi:hypothetical protein